MLDRVERRVLGALRLVDAATGATISTMMHVQASGLELMRNRVGLYVIMSATGLIAHTLAFENSPSLPAAESVEFDVRVTDPSGVYSTLVQTIRLPRPLQLPTDADPLGDLRLFEPIDIELGSTTVRRLPLGWAALSVRLNDSSGDAIAGGLVEVLPASGGDRIGFGLSGELGESLIPVSGLPMLRSDPGDPVDPADDTIVTVQTLVTCRAVVDPELPLPGNPIALDANRATLRQASLPVPVPLVVGTTHNVTLTVDLT